MKTDSTLILRTVSVGLPAEVMIYGRPVRTAIRKVAVQGPVAIHRDGVEGNRSAVHPDPVYALSAASLAFWNDSLNAGGTAWSDGYLGENLTFEGLDEADLRLGDRFRLGKAVEMTVLGPRVPCDKLAWRLGQDGSFLRRFALSGKTGFYLRVDVPGTAGAGDRMTLLARNAEAPRVADISALIWESDEVELGDIDAALAFEPLSETSRYPLRMKRLRLEERRRMAIGRWEGWRGFQVRSVTDEAPDVRSFHLVPEDGGKVAGYRAGQFLTVREPRLADVQKTRSYSLSTYDDDLAEYRITVKGGTEGSGSRALFDLWTPGGRVELRAPAGRFVADRTALEPAVLIGGGIGITPLLSMARALSRLGPSAPQIFLFACMRDAESSIFAREFADLAASHDNVTLVRVHSQPGADERQGVDFDVAGRLTTETLAAAMPDAHVVYTGTRIDIPWHRAKFYLCGPEGFEAELREAIIEAGAAPERVMTESFRVGAPAAGLGVEVADVEFRRSGRVLRWPAEGAATLLELAERAGIAARSSCRIGACQSCAARVLEGQVAYDGAPAHAPDEGYALLCCSVPASTRLTLDL